MTKTVETPGRTLTDESLAEERAKADLALESEKASVEGKADVIVERAREEADEVLTAARAKADEKLSGPVSTLAERAREDRVVENERASADEKLRRERGRTARVLARLVPLEREQTDQHLLTERARSDEAIANRDDFLGMVSHDLRDLLNGIVGNAALIAEDAGDDDHGRRTLASSQRIKRSAGRMTRLIEDLIDIASIDAGRLAVVSADADVAALVVEAVDTWTQLAAAKGVVLQAQAKGPIPMKIDSERILQVLGNLVTNALKFTPKGGTVLIGVERVADDVRFFVKDTGVGIPEDKLEAIFERFWQAGKNDRRGLGLGLYISMCVVQAHGGKIWAESQLGVGSTFFFTLAAS
jgi:signal transduction histidine kinase